MSARFLGLLPVSPGTDPGDRYGVGMMGEGFSRKINDELALFGCNRARKPCKSVNQKHVLLSRSEPTVPRLPCRAAAR
jgi:hypothetical protein